MTKRAARSLFPLHTTPFEGYMLFDDSEEYPMTFVIEFEFEGDLDRVAFQTSIDKALNRHPMLRAKIQVAKGNRECWVEADSYDSSVDWGDIDEPILCKGSGQYINLREEIGFRSWVRHDNEKARFVTLFHHSAVDGIAAYQFLGDVLWFYATEQGEELEPLIEMPTNDLRKRLRANLSDELIKPGTLEEREQAMERYGRSGQPLHSLIENPELDAQHAYPRIDTHDYDKNRHREFRLTSQEAGQTVNDVLLESLFVALCQWNQVLGKVPSGDRICINMPLDLRKDDEPQYLAANYVSYALVSRKPEQITSDPWFSDALRDELLKLKHTRFNSPFMRLLLETALENSVEEKVLENDNCLATLVFSNTGDPTRRFWAKLPREKKGIRSGNLLLTDVASSPPLRKYTRIAVGITTYMRNLRICVRADPRFLTDEHSQLFLAHFVEVFETREYDEISKTLQEFVARENPIADPV